MLFPLLAAALYAAAGLVLKAAGHQGMGVVRINVATNLLTAVGFLLFYPWREFPAAPAVWWPCLALAATFIVGQLATILAFTRGEVSVATTVLGSKVIMVALLAAGFTGARLGMELWVAALSVFAGIVLLVAPAAGPTPAATWNAFGFGLLAALGFAAFDILLQEWSPRLGFGTLISFAMALVAALSFCLLPLARGRFRDIPARAWRPLGVGTVLLAGQSVAIVWAIGRYGNAPLANVVYGSRAVLAVFAVWLLGRWVGGVERMRTRAEAYRRLAAALLTLLAIGLGVWAK